jgi:hypothetical protein
VSLRGGHAPGGSRSGICRRVPRPLQANPVPGIGDDTNPWCAHGHGDDLPDGYELMPYAKPKPVSITRVGGGKIRLSAATVLGLLAVAVFAPENAGQMIPDSFRLTWKQHTFFISAWWGRQDDFREIIGPIRSQSPSVTVDFAHLWDGWKPL